MQGRLLPPVGDHIQAFPGVQWEDEFFAAEECGLDIIEWIFEGNDWESNPILSNPEAIIAAADLHGVRVVSVIADFFMNLPLLRVSNDELKERLAIFNALIDQAGRIGVKYINVPFVDNSEIRNDNEAQEVVRILSNILPEVEERSMFLALETSLDPERFERLLQSIDHPNVKVNYDIGNSAALGYSPAEEMDAYGKSIATVHVKDRVRDGGTVPLGEGDADFDTVFSRLGEIGYDGPVVLQAARNGEEMPAIKNYMEFVRDYLEKYF